MTLQKTVLYFSGCPRCGGVVFEAERFPASNRDFHKSCATCKSCNHKLDAQSLHSGPDHEIYCGGCYSRTFGGVGYRGGIGGSNWLDENANVLLRPCQNVDTRTIKAHGDPDACRRCNGRVFELERISSRSGIWHKQCFSCRGCSVTLTSTLTNGLEGPDKEIYCKSCFSRDFGDEYAKPLTFSNTKLIKASSGEHGCPRCRGVVFEAEKVIAGENVWFHKVKKSRKFHLC